MQRQLTLIISDLSERLYDHMSYLIDGAAGGDPACCDRNLQLMEQAIANASARIKPLVAARRQRLFTATISSASGMRWVTVPADSVAEAKAATSEGLLADEQLIGVELGPLAV